MRIQHLKFQQRRIQIQHVGALHIDPAQIFVDRHTDSRTAAPLPSMGAGMVHQNLPHGARGDRKKMLAALKFECRGTRKLQIELVDESRSLECMVRPFAPQVAGSKGMQLPVEQGDHVLCARHAPIVI